MNRRGPVETRTTGTPGQENTAENHGGQQDRQPDSGGSREEGKTRFQKKARRDTIDGSESSKKCSGRRNILLMSRSFWIHGLFAGHQASDLKGRSQPRSSACSNDFSQTDAEVAAANVCGGTPSRQEVGRHLQTGRSAAALTGVKPEQTALTGGRAEQTGD